jgi:alkylation response protein AidB-like acyl-CoA dehydrogenase
MDFKLTEAEEALKKEFEEFFEAEMKNAPPEYGNGGLEAIYGTEEGNAFHKSMARKMGDKGWISMAWPKAYGGRDATIMEQMIFNEVRARYRAPGIDGFGVGMFAPTLLVGANEEQKQRLLPPIAKGEVFYCQGWSEPDAGSDLASLTTLAIREGDFYVVNGQKAWTTGGHRVDHMFLLARTDPDSKRSKGLSVFNLRMNLPGIEIRPLLYMDGRHIYNEVFFKDVRIPADDLVGTEGDGWNLTRQTMNFERSNSGAYASVKQTLGTVVEYMKTTKRDGKYLSENPINRKKMVQLFIDSEVGQALAYKTAWYQQKKDFMNVVSAASAGKLFATELGQKMSNFVTEIIGPYGQLENCPLAPFGGSMVELYQFCKGQTIYAGSNEIQRNLIAWVGLGLPRLKFRP